MMKRLIAAMILGLSLTARAAVVIGAGDERFVYEGRFDLSDANRPVVVWQASEISLDFEGDSIGLDFDQAKGRLFFNVGVDDSNRAIEVKSGEGKQTVGVTGLGTGRHHLVLFKRTEASAGSVRFDGVELGDGMGAWKPQGPAYKLKMQFIGDSITVGACNEDGAADQWENLSTHNAALSYATLTAQAFDADYRNIAVSGMGVVGGWVKIHVDQMWDRVYPDANSAKADLTGWKPDVVLVNLGENDDSYPRAHKQPFPATWTDGYVALIDGVRAAYPDAHIVLLRGGMWGGSQSKELKAAWDAAVQRLEAKDQKISHFAFTHWTGHHPRVADDRAMADELIGFLKAEDFMAAYK